MVDKHNKKGRIIKFGGTVMSDEITTILSVIGAVAWLSVLFTFIANRLRKIHMTLLDCIVESIVYALI